MKKWIVTASETAYVTRTIEAETANEAMLAMEDLLLDGDVTFEDYGDRSYDCEKES